MTDIQFLGVGDNGSLTRKELAHIQQQTRDVLDIIVATDPEKVIPNVLVSVIVTLTMDYAVADPVVTFDELMAKARRTLDLAIERRREMSS